MLLASICAGAGQLTMTRSFRELPVAEGSLLQMFVPLGTAGGGILFFGEHFALREWAGVALIFGGTAFTPPAQTHPRQRRGGVIRRGWSTLTPTRLDQSKRRLAS